MGKHESSVNFQKLIQDLADMYPFEVPEVIVVELVANSLDAGATRIAIDYDARRKVLVVEDNGKGMDDVQFDEYHDFAAGLKTRGSGIGFAGVGAKISFNVADRVTTETRSTTFLAGSDWYLESGKRLVWEDIRPTHLAGRGTRVEVHFRGDAAPSFTSTEHLEESLRRHYLPLLDTRFLELYEELGLYHKELRFAVNGQRVATGNVEQLFGLDKVKTFLPKSSGKRVGYGVLGLSATEYPLGLDSCGVLVCTHGKVIKAELFNQFPGTYGPRLFGLVEIPQLVNHLTTSKTDFIRSKGKYREFEKLYDPLRQEFKAWLGDLGVQLAEAGDAVEAARLERELRKLVEEVPELSDLFGFRSSSKVLQQADGGDVPATSVEGAEVTFPVGEGTKGGTPGPVDLGDQPGTALVENAQTGTERANPVTRTARRGPRITFVSAPERLELAWVEGNSVIVNSGHPSYKKVRNNQAARTVHSFFAIGTAVLRFMATPEQPQDMTLVDRLMTAWGNK